MLHREEGHAPVALLLCQGFKCGVGCGHTFTSCKWCLCCMLARGRMLLIDGNQHAYGCIQIHLHIRELIQPRLKQRAEQSRLAARPASVDGSRSGHRHPHCPLQVDGAFQALCHPLPVRGKQGLPNCLCIPCQQDGWPGCSRHSASCHRHGSRASVQPHTSSPPARTMGKQARPRASPRTLPQTRTAAAHSDGASSSWAGCP